MKPKVSVILPSLNVADYIEECLDSVVSQSLRELEIICVDAKSMDGTAEILKQYAEEDERITILFSDIKSYGRQVNLGLDYASGEYIAVLETDDWIMPEMYECLYERALSDDLDYAAADFDTFYRLQNGAYYQIRQRLFDSGRQDWYGRILDSDHLATLRASDYVLWKGIYNRTFLNENHIRLHESPGAAFQDTGFLQQVKTYAKKAVYLDRSFYRYRQDRESASSKGLEGLRHYEREFRWINDELHLNSYLNSIHRKYYDFTMSISFVTKYEQIMVELQGNWRDKRLSDPYEWFKRQIQNAVDSGILDESMYGKERWEQLKLLLASPESFSRFIMDRRREGQFRAERFSDMIKNRPVIIFGCGARGERLMFYCNSNRINIAAFCDNNKLYHDSKKYGFSVISPSCLKDKLEKENAVVILSMKNSLEEVKNQLAELGIEPEQIIDHIPEGIL